MNKQNKREDWLEDLDRRQRNIVFPYTTQNEARFWRNLGTFPSGIWAKVGLLVLATFVLVWAAIIIVATWKAGVVWEFILGMVFFCGLAFGLIAWATRRSLTNLRNEGPSRKGKPGGRQ